MSQVVDFKCPCCGGYVEFDPDSQRFKCLYCGQLLDENDLQDRQQTQIPVAETETGKNAKEEHTYRAYHCQSCGAQIVTTETTAATRCYYCHNPVVLQDRLSGDFRPDGVIPFELDKDGAKEAFRKFIKGKKFVDRQFYQEANLEDFGGVYYPYWMGNVEGIARFTGDGTRISVMHGPQFTTTTTKHFRVQREGRITFRNMFRKALSSADRILAEGIHPYRYDEIKDYNPGYLSGFMAEMRDVDEKTVRDEMLREVRQAVPSMMKQGHTFQTLSGDTSFDEKKVDIQYVLLPAWVMTYKGKQKDAVYYYMMNGQTGEVCGRLPINKGKLLAWCAGAGLAVFALLCAGGAFLW